MAFFDEAQAARFDGVIFPVDRVEVSGGIRDAIHEYPHQAGGQPELLGRKLYTIRMHGVFDEGILQYPGNYPESLATLRAKFEAQTISDLTIPTLGTIKAYCRDWPQTWVATVRSGETAEFTFVEKMSDLTFTSRIDLDAIPEFAENLVVQRSDIYGPDETQPTIWDDIDAVALEIASLRDSLGTQQFLQKVYKLDNLISTADRQLKELQNPNAWRVLSAMKDLQASARLLAVDVNQTAQTIQTYTVPRRMTAAEVSRAIFNVPTRAMDILDLNPIEDAFAIRAGTSIRYYANAA